MDPSYSLRIPVPEKVNTKRRKRKVIYSAAAQVTSSFKYACYQCAVPVYFLPGHELVCPTCASRIVEKIHLAPHKREVVAR